MPCLVKPVAVEPRLVIVWHGLAEHDLVSRWHQLDTISGCGGLTERLLAHCLRVLLLLLLLLLLHHHHHLLWVIAELRVLVLGEWPTTDHLLLLVEVLDVLVLTSDRPPMRGLLTVELIHHLLLLLWQWLLLLRVLLGLLLVIVLSFRWWLLQWSLRRWLSVR